MPSSTTRQIPLRGRTRLHLHQVHRHWLRDLDEDEDKEALSFIASDVGRHCADDKHKGRDGNREGLDLEM